MDKFIYEARDQAGKIVKGIIEADSIESAEDVLKYNQLAVITIKPYLSFNDRIMSYLSGFLGGIKPKDKAIFSRQLSTMINAGLPLVDALKYLAKQTPNKRLTGVIYKIIALIEKGKSFSFALSQFPDVFSPIFVNMIKSGEASGKLDKVLLDLAEQLESDYAMKSKIWGAMIYPAFILFVIAIVGTLALIYIIPQLEDIFTSSGAQLPLLTRLLISLSHFMRGYWYLAVLIIIGLGILIKYLTLTVSGKYVISYLSLSFPVFKTINRGIYITNFAKTLALLVSGGVPIIKSLSMVSDSLGNSIVEKELKYALLEVEKGIPLSTPLTKSKIFPGLVSSMVAVGEQTGQLDKILFDIARIYEQDTNNLLKGITALLEPVIMLIVGIAVLFLVVAIIMPIYQLSNVF